jgi:hypothetical protein
MKDIQKDLYTPENRLHDLAKKNDKKIEALASQYTKDAKALNHTKDVTYAGNVSYIADAEEVPGVKSRYPEKSETTYGFIVSNQNETNCNTPTKEVERKYRGVPYSQEHEWTNAVEGNSDFQINCGGKDYGRGMSFEVFQHQVGYIKRDVLTIIEAAGLNDKQHRALRTLIRRAFYEGFVKAREFAFEGRVEKSTWPEIGEEAETL